MATKSQQTGVAPLATFSPDTNKYVRTLKNGYRLYNLRQVLSVADKHNFGVVAANIRSPWILNAVLNATWKLHAPIILEIAESETGYCEMPPSRLSDLVHDGIEKMIKQYNYEVPVVLHHDHIQKDVDGCVKRAVEAGFSSVEVDLSKKPVEENAAKCTEVVNLVHPLGISLEVEEGEIGTAAALADPEVEKNIADYYTKVADAEKLVSAVGADAIAFFVGNGHGQYLKKPIIGFDRIREICDMAGKYGTYGVLHGGTGLTAEDFNRAIHNGARKFNYATALSDIWFAHFPKALLEKMDAFAKEKGKARRYILNNFLPEIAKLDHSAAEKKIEEHMKFMIEKAFLSADKANLYASM
ncbi:class II fructose-bisphosphate aldolase [Candidatus Peregrinibacteria bacterium]|nr:class II fructose-bisphosphate aldolase [Candidatus Peregrinibacteria bacterium]